MLAAYCLYTSQMTTAPWFTWTNSFKHLWDTMSATVIMSIPSWRYLKYEIQQKSKVFQITFFEKGDKGLFWLWRVLISNYDFSRHLTLLWLQQRWKGLWLLPYFSWSSGNVKAESHQLLDLHLPDTTLGLYSEQGGVVKVIRDNTRDLEQAADRCLAEHESCSPVWGV